MGYRSNTVSSIMIIYGHSRSLSFPASLDYYSGSLPSPLSTKESTLRPSGSCCPGSSSTNVSRILVSTCSDGSSVRTFFFPKIRPTRITWPQNLCVPYASAVTYARCPTFSFETSLSSTSKAHSQNGIIRHGDHRRIELRRDALSAVPQRSSFVALICYLIF